MEITVVQTSLEAILPLRTLFLQECNFQVRYDACHIRGWTDEYLFISSEKPIGYGSVKGRNEFNDRDAIFEFYLLPQYRDKASVIFGEFIKVSKVAFIECQSNDLLLSGMMFEFGKNIYSDVVLFKAGAETRWMLSDVVFRPRLPGDKLAGKGNELDNGYVIVINGQVAGAGGYLLHYNKPFADLYMEVAPEYRKQGLGCFLIQELKKACYDAGRVPAARCNISNPASKATLLKGGMEIAGYMLTGTV